MDKLIVGEGKLKIRLVARAIETSSTFSELLKGWRSFARNLELDEANILELERKANSGIYQLKDIPREILHIWKASNGSHATLQVLWDVLIECDLRDIAESLKVFCNQEEKTIVPERFCPPVLPKYYIRRTLVHNTELEENIFTDDTTNDHLFLVKGITKTELAKISGFKAVDFSGNQAQQSKINVKFMVLEYDGDFETIREKTTQPVHMLEYKNKCFFSIKSSDRLDIIKRFLKIKPQDGIAEDEMVSRIASYPDACNLSIADTPGMGKTFVMANLASKIKADERTLVIFLVFQEFIQQVKKVDSSSSVLEAISAFVFSSSVKLEDHRIYLFLDGYDEVQSNKLDLADSTLQCLTKLGHVNVIVSTRPHLQSRLEGILQMLSYEIQPFNETNQIDFLKRFWVCECEANEHDILETFANQILKVLKEATTDSGKGMPGIPLQCMLLAEAHAKDAKRASLIGSLREGSVKKFSIFGMYKALVDHKLSLAKFDQGRRTRFSTLTKRWKDFNQALTGSHNEERLRQKYIEAHMHDSISLLFPDWMDKFNSNFKSRKKIKDTTIYAIGLIEKSSNTTTPRFIHRTFAEYFFAEFAVKYLSKYAACVELLLIEIFGLKGSEEYTRSALPKYRCKYEVIANFINIQMQNNFSISELDPRAIFKNVNLSMITVEDLCVAANLCCTHNLENCFDLFTKLLHYINIRNNLDLIDKYFQELPHISIEESKDVSLLRKVLTFTNSEFGKDLGYHMSFVEGTVIQKAVKDGVYNVVVYLVEEFNSHVIQTANLLHSCVANSLSNSESVVQDKLLIIDFLLRTNRNWLVERDDVDCPPILSTAVHLELLKSLHVHGADINSYSSEEGTILHKVLGNCKEVMRWALDNGFKLINHQDLRKRTPLMYVIQKCNLYLDMEILEWFSSAGADFNAEDTAGDSVLFHAIRSSIRIPNFVNILQQILDNGANLNQTNKEMQTAAHITMDLVNSPDNVLSILELLHSRGFRGFNQKGSNGFTPLMYIKNHQNEMLGEKILQFFYIVGTDFNSKDNDGNSVLFHVIQNVEDRANCIRFVEIILGYGGNLNHRNNKKQTVAHIAQYELNLFYDPVQPKSPEKVLDILKLLCAREFSHFNEKDSDGCTPLDIALSWRRPNKREWEMTAFDSIISFFRQEGVVQALSDVDKGM